MIPEIFHRIWFGDKPIPAQYERYWQAWQRQYPHYQFITWRDADIDSSFSLHALIQTAEGMARKADIARYEILLKQGGIYLDCDMMPYHYLDWHSLDSDFIVCNETLAKEYCSIGMIASSKNNIILQQAVKQLQLTKINLQPPNIETGPYFFAKALQAGPHKMLPVAAFYPYLGNEPYSAILSRDLSKTFGIHVWGGSWFDEAQIIEKAGTLIRHGDLAELNSLGAKGSDNLKKSLLEFTRLTQSARASLLAAANHPVFVSSFTLDSTFECEFLKCAFFLLETETQADVWQIGAADGILVDPLRALLINFDPRAYLFEPNPFLFARLKSNLANNKNATLLNMALGKSNGTLNLNTVNLEKAAAADLPDWVAGISSFYVDRNALGGLTIDETLTKKIQACTEKVSVEMIDVSALLKKTGNRHPAIVVIDVEGMDAEIVALLLDAGVRPRIVQFEIQCLPPQEIVSITKRLEGEYIQFNFGNDRVAYHKDFFKQYCDYIYIHYGIPTYYKQILRDLVKC